MHVIEERNGCVEAEEGIKKRKIIKPVKKGQKRED